MANAEFLKVHHYRRRPGTNEVQLTRKTPYKAFVSQGQPTVFIREGQAFAEDGDRFEGGIPGWVMEELQKMKAKDLLKLGFKKEEIAPNAEAVAQEAEKEAQPAVEEAPAQLEQSEGDLPLFGEGSQGDVQGLNSPLAERRARRGR